MMNSIKSQLIDLWRTSFNDSEAFIKLFFDRVYKEENALFIEKDGKIVSALQMLPYVMNYYGTEIPVSYLYAACTLPSERGQGLMRQLIGKAFEVMKSRGAALTVTIPADPWLFDYYRDLGYTAVFDYSKESYIRPHGTALGQEISIVSPETFPMESIYAFYHKKQQERSCHILHSYADFVTIHHDFLISDGQILAAINTRNEPIGVIFSYPTDTHIHVKELMYDNDSIKNQLLQEVTKLGHIEKAICRTPPTGSETFPLGMAHILDRDRLIRHWSSTHENSSPNIETLKGMELHELTRLLFGYQKREAFMNMMLD